VSPLRAFLVGAVVSGGVSAVLALRARGRLLDRAALLQEALTTDGRALEATLLQGGSALEADLREAGQGYAQTVAQGTAERVLATYGITPARMRRLVATQAAFDGALRVLRGS
jgi:hypothetical protein